MKSSYSKRTITTRTTYSTGATVTPGPPVSATYPLGYFREDYQYNITSSATPDYLDEHNGRYCITPEYPLGIYCYFATVDANWNSAYPYLVGPTFYGTKVVADVAAITGPVTEYIPSPLSVSDSYSNEINATVFPNPANDLVAIQITGLRKENVTIELYDITGRFIQKTSMYQGSTIAYFDTQKLYSGQYLVKIISGTTVISKKITIIK
jgi:hypothetical protein